MPSSALGTAIATTSTASFCQSFKRLRKFMSVKSLSNDSISEFLPLAVTIGSGCGHLGAARGAAARCWAAALAVRRRLFIRAVGYCACRGLGPAHARHTRGATRLAPGQIAEPVGSHHLVQGMGFVSHGLRGGSCLFDERCILLSQLVHLQHGLVDLSDPSRLLTGCCSNFGHDVRDLLHRSNNLFKSLTRPGDIHRAVFNLLDAVLDEILDFLRSGRGAARQRPHLY